MAIVRLGAHTPAANTSYALYNVTTSYLVSVIAANTLTAATTSATKVDIWVVPQGVTNPIGYAYITSNLEVGLGQSFETFKFGVVAGDSILVKSTTAGTSFVVQGMSQDSEYSINNVPITFTNKIIRGNDNIIYPDTGTTAQRPSAAETGYWRYNTDLNYIEFKTPTGWAAAMGPTGPQGIQGISGQGLAIKGSYASSGALTTAVPTGTLGDGYLVGSDLYIWDGNSWENVGPILGPTGPTGPSGGPTGPTGPQGAQGPAGSASAYAPETSANWNAPVPATIDDALDQLATRVKTATFSSTTDATAASITIDEVAYSAIARLVVTANGTTAYQFNSHYSGDNPTIFVLGGTTIAFNLSEASHPFKLQEDIGSGFVDISAGLTHVTTEGVITTNASAQEKTSGTLYWNVPLTAASGGYKYICDSHGIMVGTITHKSLNSI
jgi:plastocyanin